MTQDEIIEMARQAGFMMENSAAIQAAESFAKLVAAKEREALAQRTWVGLTDVEIKQAIELISMLHGDYATEVAYAIEAKLKEKNT